MTVPVNMLPQRTPPQLLNIARQGLNEAKATRSDGMRYAAAHLAALRVAAAVVAARATAGPKDSRSRVPSIWSLLSSTAPEFSEWAECFAAGSTKRAAAEAGIPHMVTASEADELVSAAERFLSVVEVALGVAR